MTLIKVHVNAVPNLAMLTNATDTHPLPVGNNKNIYTMYDTYKPELNPVPTDHLRFRLTLFKMHVSS